LHVPLDRSDEPYARGTISPNPERNGPPLRLRGGFGKIFGNFRRVTFGSIITTDIETLIHFTFRLNKRFKNAIISQQLVVL